MERATTPRERRPASDRAGGAWRGAVSVAFVIASGLFFGGAPRTGATTVDIVTFYGSRSHWHDVEIAVVLAGVSMLFFIVFLGHLRARLADVEGTPRIAAIAFGAGLVFVAFFGGLNVARGAIAFALDDG